MCACGLGATDVCRVFDDGSKLDDVIVHVDLDVFRIDLWMIQYNRCTF
jgi:hypothetical protein